MLDIGVHCNKKNPHSWQQIHITFYCKMCNFLRKIDTLFFAIVEEYELQTLQLINSVNKASKGTNLFPLLNLLTQSIPPETTEF